MKGIPVVVLSRNFATGLSVVRSLGAAGHTADLVLGTGRAENTDLVAVSKYVRDFVKVVASKKDGERILKEALLGCAKKYKEKAILIPADKNSTLIIDRYRPELENYFLMPSVGGKSTDAFSGRAAQMSKAVSAGLNVPYEFVIRADSPAVVPENAVYPCICVIRDEGKPKTGTAVCGNRAELQARLSYLRKRAPKAAILIRQQCKADSVISLAGVSRDGEIYCPAYVQSTHVAFYKTRSTVTGVLHSIDDLKEDKEKVCNFLKSFGYTGPFNLKLRVSEGEIYFDKLMFCCGRQSYVCSCSGANLLDALVKAFTGEDFIPEKADIAFGTTSVNDMAAWEDYIRGYITKKQLTEVIRKADVRLIANSDDPAPGRLFLMNMKKAAASRRLDRFIRRLTTRGRTAQK